MGKLLSLKCETCGVMFPPDGEIQDFCPKCGQRFGTLESILDMKQAAADLKALPLQYRDSNSMLRYHFLLPFENASVFPPIRIGMTPMYSRPALAEQLGVKAFWIKDDGLNPSGSYKDRASAVVVARAKELGKKTVACASTGNAAASLAGCCAASGLNCIVFVPENAPAAKLTQIAAFGATLVAVQGTYDQAFDLATEACKRYDWFNRSAGLNPYLVEGKKTGALEICEALNMDPPDAVFVGVGDGSIITGVCKGFNEFHTLGLISRIPKVIGVQAEGSGILVKAYQEYLKTGIVDFIPGEAHTCADSISVGNPREGIRALKAVKQTGGTFLGIPDDEIQAAMRDLPRLAGVFCEPSGAIGLAGIRRAQLTGVIDSNHRVVMMNTGSGLKDTAGMQNALHMEIPKIKPYIEEVDKLHLDRR